MYIYITFWASDRDVKAQTSGLEPTPETYSNITTVYSWQTETGKPYCYIESLYNMVNIFRTVPDK